MICNRWVPVAQWLALVTMTVEHLARFALPISDAWMVSATLLGRGAMPLFAAMIAWHIVHNTRDSIRYARRLLVIGLVAQLPYMLAIGSETLNVLFTLAAGIIISSASLNLYKLLAALVVALTAAVYPASFTYGLMGVLLVPAFVLAIRAPWSAPVLLLVVWGLNDSWLYSLVALVCALVVLGIYHGVLRLSFNVMRVPRRLWLAWYPVHLFMIGLYLSLDQISNLV